MATIQRPLKTYGTRNYVGEVAAAPSNEDPILANEVDADLDTMYGAWNAGTDTVNIKDGAVTYAKLAADAKLWTRSGTSLVPTTATDEVKFGSLTPKGRLFGGTSTDNTTYLTTNITYGGVQDTTAISSWWLGLISSTGGANSTFKVTHTGPGGSGGQNLVFDGLGNLTLSSATAEACTGTFISRGTIDATYGQVSLMGGPATGARNRHITYGTGDYYLTFNQLGNGAFDDTAKPSWWFSIYTSPNPSLTFGYGAAGGGALVQQFAVSAGNLTILGATATKASGTTWANPSDIRLKRDVAEYTTGLDAIRQLRPISFKYNGKGGTMDDDRPCWGLVADEAAAVMPELVSTTKAKLDADDEEDSDILSLDASNVTWALVNAVKELATRVADLEAK